MAFADTQKLVVELDLKGNLQSGLAKATKSVQGFDRATSNTQRSLSKFGSNIGKTFAIGAAAATAGAFAVVRAASDYESAFAGVRKTVDATEAQLQELSDDFRSLAKTIPISAAELASLGEVGGALGIPIEQMEEFVRVTALLGVTTDLTSEQAATSIGILGNVLHLTGDEYSKFASSLVALGNAGASTESQIVSIAERAGAAGELVGVSTEKILGFSSAVASLGIDPEAGGTALQKFFIDSAKFIAEGGEELEIFAKVSGTSARQIKKNFDKDAGAALQRFLANLGKLDQGEQLRVLEDLGFNDARITRTLLGLAGNTELVAEQQQIANDAFRENTALTKEAEQRFKTFDSQLQITKNVLTDIGITIGSKLLPKLVPLLQRFNEFVNQNQGGIEKFGTDLAQGFERFADAVGKTDWQPFIDGLKLSASLAKGAFDAFNALPDDFKKLVLVGFGINKFTGGLLTSIGKDLAAGLGQQFLARGANPGNPLFVKEVGLAGGAGAAGAAGAAGGRGLLGTIANGAMKVFIVGAVADIASTLAPAVNQAGRDLGQALGFPQFDIGLNDLQWPFGPKNTPTILPELFGGNGLLGGEATPEVIIPENPRLEAKLGQVAFHQNITNERLDAIKAQTIAGAAKVAAQMPPIRSEMIGVRQAQATAAATLAAKIGSGTAESARIRMAVDANKAATVAKIGAGTAESARIRQAINAKDFSPTIKVGVSIRNVVSAQNQLKTIYRTQS